MSDSLVEQARAGSQHAFEALASPHRRALQVHCYRMLGSIEDAEDAVQETLLKAWTRVSTYAGSSTFHAWLYAIATNVCLDALRHRRSRAWPTDIADPAHPRRFPKELSDLPWLQPYPDALMPSVAAPSAEEEVVKKETIELAFLAAIQHLPPRQRAVLILRDVLSWSAKDVAATLTMTPVAVNSALQRAHSTLAARLPDRTNWPSGRSADEGAVLEQLTAAWESADTDTLVGLLAADVRLVMPPRLAWFQGRHDVATFLRDHVFDELGATWRLLRTAANGQPAFGLYMRTDEEASFHPFGVAVVRLGEAGIEEIAIFMDNPALVDIFELRAAI